MEAQLVNRTVNKTEVVIQNNTYPIIELTQLGDKTTFIIERGFYKKEVFTWDTEFFNNKDKIDSFIRGSNESYAKIAKKLNKQGFVTKSGGKWTNNSVYCYKTSSLKGVIKDKKVSDTSVESLEKQNKMSLINEKDSITYISLYYELLASHHKELTLAIEEKRSIDSKINDLNNRKLELDFKIKYLTKTILEAEQIVGDLKKPTVKTNVLPKPGISTW